MGSDIGFIIFTVLLVGVSAFIGIHVGRREARYPAQPLQPWQLWMVYTVQVVASGMIFTAWRHVLSSFWGQVGQMLLILSLVMVAALEGRRSMFIINALLAVLVAVTIR